MPRTLTVLSPVADRTYRPDPVQPAPRLPTLDGARVAFVDNGFQSTRHVHAVLVDALVAQGIQPLTVRKKYWRRLAASAVTEIAGGADALVSGICTTPPSTTWGVIDSVAVERLGLPTVTLVADYYLPLAQETAEGEGMTELCRVTVPYPIEDRPSADLEAIAATILPAVVAALTQPREDQP